MNQVEQQKPQIFNETEKMVALTAAMSVGLATGSFVIGAIVGGVALLVIHFWKYGYVGTAYNAIALLFRKALAPKTAEMGDLALAMGRDVMTGRFVIRTLDEIGSLGVYSLTRFGKTRLLQTLIHQIVTRMHPNQVKLAIVDPERFDYRIWQSVPHLAYPIARSQEDAVHLINLIAEEMDHRGDLFSSMPEHHICNSLDHYHDLIDELGLDSPKLPRIVFLIDEMDLYTKKGSELEIKLKHLAKRGQKRGIYLWVSTQRPTVDTLNADIRAELTARLVGHMESQGDYYRVHSIPKEVYQYMTGKKGRFMFYNEGEWCLMDGAYQPERVMERAAQRVSAGLQEPEWDRPGGALVKPKRPWQGSLDQKATMVREWMAGLGQKPTAAEFMAEFDVRSSNTANSWIEKIWRKR